MLPLKSPTAAPRPTLLLPLMLALSLTGCATTSPTPEHACPRFPTKPVSTEPLPSKPYSLSVQETLKAWREKLMATPMTP